MYQPIAYQNAQLIGSGNEVDNTAEALFLEMELRKNKIGQDAIYDFVLAKIKLPKQLEADSSNDSNNEFRK